METSGVRARLFAGDGALLVDSRELAAPTGRVEIEELPPPRADTGFARALSSLFDRALHWLPRRRRLAALSGKRAPGRGRLRRSGPGAGRRGRRGRAQRRPGGHGHQRRGPGPALQTGAGRVDAVEGFARHRGGAPRGARRHRRGVRGRPRRDRAAISLSRRNHRAADPALGCRRRKGPRPAQTPPCDPIFRAPRRRDRRAGGRASRHDGIALAAHGRDRAVRRRRRPRDQEPAHLAPQRGRDRGPG